MLFEAQGNVTKGTKAPQSPLTETQTEQATEQLLAEKNHRQRRMVIKPQYLKDFII